MGTIGGKTAKGNERDAYLNATKRAKESLKRCHSNRNGTISQRFPDEPPLPKTKLFSDCTKPKDVVEIRGMTIGGLKCFATRDDGRNSPLCSQEGQQHAKELAAILLHLSSNIFGLSASSLHLYWDSGAKHIAFNIGGALFFNVYFHAKVKPYDGSREGGLVYWLSTLVHELAHNTRGPHDEEFNRVCHHLWEAYFTKASESILSVKNNK